MALPDSVFEAQYEVHDGYVCSSRPQTFHIDAEDLEDDMGDEALRIFYDSEVIADFEDSGKIYPEPQKVDQFIAWARGQLAKREMEKL
jgi:hypothetical protein